MRSHHLILFSIAFLLTDSRAVVAQCIDKRADDGAIELEQAIPRQLHDSGINGSEQYVRLGRLLSSDATVAVPEFRKAIKHRRGLEIYLCCYAAESAEVRVAALNDYLKLETYEVSEFREMLKWICSERISRLQEIETAAKIDPKQVTPGEGDQADVRISIEKLCSIDPTLARPELRRAIRFRKSTEILLCSLTGGDPGSRVLAISYLLHNENATRDEFRRRIQRICCELCARLREIDQADTPHNYLAPLVENERALREANEARRCSKRSRRCSKRSRRCAKRSRRCAKQRK